MKRSTKETTEQRLAELRPSINVGGKSGYEVLSDSTIRSKAFELAPSAYFKASVTTADGDRLTEYKFAYDLPDTEEQMICDLSYPMIRADLLLGIRSQTDTRSAQAVKL